MSSPVRDNNDEEIVEMIREPIHEIQELLIHEDDNPLNELAQGIVGLANQYGQDIITLIREMEPAERQLVMSLAQENRLQRRQLAELRGIADAVNTQGERVVANIQQLEGSLVTVGQQIRGAIDDTNNRINDLTTAMNTTAHDILTRLSEIRDAQTAANEIKSLLKGIYKQIWDGLEYMLHLLYLLHLWWWTLRDPTFSVIPSAISSFIPCYIIIISIAWSVLEYILFCYVIVDIFIMLITTGVQYIAGTPVIDWVGGFLMTTGWAITCIVLKGLFKFATIIGWNNPIVKAVITILQSICKFFLDIPIVGYIIGCLGNILELIQTGWEAWKNNPSITHWMNILFTYIGTQVYKNMPSMGLWGGKSSSKNSSHKNTFSEEELKDSIRKINDKLEIIKKQITNKGNKGVKDEFFTENPDLKVLSVETRVSKSSPSMFSELIRKFNSIKSLFMETSKTSKFTTKDSQKIDIKTIHKLLTSFELLIKSIQKTGTKIFTLIKKKSKQNSTRKTKAMSGHHSKTKPRKNGTRKPNIKHTNNLKLENFLATQSQ